MKSYPRSRKVNEALKEELADILVKELKDPRLDLVTVTSVSVSPDMRHADVFVTAHGGADRYVAALDGLESAKGRIRRLLGRRLKMKFLPELRFLIDESVDQGMRILEALRREGGAEKDGGEGDGQGDEGGGRPGGQDGGALGQGDDEGGEG